MRWLACLVLSILAAGCLVVAGCGSSKDVTPVVGTYILEYEDSAEDLAEMGISEKLELKDDGTYILSGTSNEFEYDPLGNRIDNIEKWSSTGTYTYSGRAVILHEKGSKEAVSYQLEGEDIVHPVFGTYIKQ